MGILIDDPAVPIDLDTKMSTVIPQEWRLQDPIAQKSANLVDLFGLRTGLPPHSFVQRGGLSLADLVSKFRYLRPSAEFREG